MVTISPRIVELSSASGLQSQAYHLGISRIGGSEKTEEAEICVALLNARQQGKLQPSRTTIFPYEKVWIFTDGRHPFDLSLEQRAEGTVYRNSGDIQKKKSLDPRTRRDLEEESWRVEESGEYKKF